MKTQAGRHADCSCLLLAAPGCSWLLLVAHGCFWWFLAALAGLLLAPAGQLAVPTAPWRTGKSMDRMGFRILQASCQLQQASCTMLWRQLPRLRQRGGATPTPSRSPSQPRAKASLIVRADCVLVPQSSSQTWHPKQYQASGVIRAEGVPQGSSQTWQPQPLSIFWA